MVLLNLIYESFQHIAKEQFLEENVLITKRLTLWKHGGLDKLPSVTEEDDFYRMNNGCQILEMNSNVMAYPQSKNEL